MTWDASAIAALIEDYERSIPEWGWPNWVIGSHDAPRIAARVGAAQARVAMMLLLTLRGTPTLYQGDELAIGEVAIPPDRVCDPREIMQPGIGLGRDRSRTPMPWAATDNAGFTTVSRGCRLTPTGPSATSPRKKATRVRCSTLRPRYWRFGAPNRRCRSARFAQVEGANGILSYVRREDGDALVVVLNLGENASSATVAADGPLMPLLSTLGAPSFEQLARGASIPLRPNEGLVLRVSA